MSHAAHNILMVVTENADVLSYAREAASQLHLECIFIDKINELLSKCYDHSPSVVIIEISESIQDKALDAVRSIKLDSELNETMVIGIIVGNDILNSKAKESGCSIVLILDEIGSLPSVLREYKESQHQKHYTSH